MKKRMFSMFLIICMVFTLLPGTAFAEDLSGQLTVDASTVCPHHKHGVNGGESCGFAEGTPCTHVCGEDCKGDMLGCKHEHDSACGFTEGTLCTFNPSNCIECIQADSGENAAMGSTITAFSPLTEDIRYQRNGAASLKLPETLTASVDGAEIEIPVTWDGAKDMNAMSGGFYILTANVGDTYALADGAELPIITALVLGRGRIAGTGTAASPLQITNEIQLREVAALVNEDRLERFILGENSAGQVYLKLMNDISLSGEWTPIGGAGGGPFRSVFDGNGKTISGVRINQPDTDDIGLFGFINGVGAVKNLIVSNAQISGRDSVGSVAGNSYGDVTGCTVNDSQVSGNINIGGVIGNSYGDITGSIVNDSEVNGNQNTGGVAGYSEIDVIGCSVNNSEIKGNIRTGGVVGHAFGTVTRSYATGNVSSSGDFTGGVVGRTDGSVTGSYATGNVSGFYYVGGVVGYANGTVTGCAALNSSVSGSDQTGRVFGSSSYYGIGNAAFAGMLDRDGGLFATDDGTRQNGTDIDLTTLDGKFTSGDGWTDFTSATLPALVGVGQQTVERPLYLIDNPTDYPFGGGDGSPDTPFKLDSEDHLRILATLVNNGSSYEGKYFLLTKDIIITGGVWIPIGTEVNPFKGIFNGDGHTISGVQTDDLNASAVGLFGVIETGYIQRLGVLDVQIKGKDSVGGIVGIVRDATIRESYVTGVVEGGSISVGGLTGHLKGTLLFCYSTAVVKGNNQAGGLAGSAEFGFVDKCYAAGNVDGIEYVGGLVGRNNSARVINCAALNKEVNGSSYVGRVFAVTSYAGSGNAAYERMTNNGTLFLEDDGTGENGKHINLDTLDGMFPSLEGIWTGFTSISLPALLGVGQQSVGRLPYLFGDMGGIFNGSGTKEDPYLIRSELELRALAAQVNGGSDYADKHFKLWTDITLTSGDWIPIGSDIRPFNGLFDGTGKKVSNLEIDRSDMDFAGLFGATGSQSVIKNIQVVNADIIGNDSTGGVVGSAGGLVENCSSIGGNVSGNNVTGGVVGQAKSDVTGCYAAGGSVNGQNSRIGGVIGQALGSVEGCYAAVSVIGNNQVGGVVGHADSEDTIKDCYATGNVSGTEEVGGVVGYSNGSVETCYATGSVSGTKEVGGVVGYSSNSVINCVALNPSVSSTGTSSGRVTGGKSKIVSGCFAYIGMELQENGAVKTPVSQQDNRDGASINKQDIKSAVWWQGVGFSSWWIIADNKLPVLSIMENGDLPIYLTDTFGKLPGITGPDSGVIRLPSDGDTYFGPFEISSESRYEVSVSHQDTNYYWWSSEKMGLIVKKGLAPGEYPLVLTVSNAVGSVTHNFTLKVETVSDGGGDDGSGGRVNDGGGGSGNVPMTGDGANMALFLIFAACSLYAAFAVVIIQRRRNRSRSEK